MNADQFKLRMAQLPEPITNLQPPYWQYWRLDLWQRAQTQNPALFWKWPCVYHTMCQNHWPNSIEYELSQLNISHLDHHLQIPHFGPDDPLSGTNYSMNLIHQAYHIQQWEQVTGRKINQLNTIVEFGGGYGAMVLLCHRLGFDGKYIIYDLPEFSLLQEYYLSQFGLLDKVSWNPKRKPKDIDLFMALYSLSEVEPADRFDYLIKAKSFLFLYSGQWEKWDNVHFFQNANSWQKSNFTPYFDKPLKWHHTELTHLSTNKNNWYSIGY